MIFNQVRYFRQTVISAVLFSVMAAFLAGATIALIGIFVQGLTNPSEPPIKSGIQWFDTLVLATQAPPGERIYRLSGFILLVIWLQSTFMYLGQIYSRLSAIKLTDRLKKALFDQLESLSLSFYLKARPGDLINSIHLETNMIQVALDVLSVFVTDGSILLVYLALMIFLSWQLTVAAVLAFGLLSVGISVISRMVREASFEVPKRNKKFASMALEFVNGIKTVHASVTQDYERARFYKATENIAAAKSKVAMLSVLVVPLTKGISGTVMILLIAVAFNALIQKGDMRPAVLLTFLLTLSRTMPLVTHINRAITQINGFQGSLSNIRELLRRDNKPYLQNGKHPFLSLKKSIDFVSVDFGYNPDEIVLHDITLSFQKGKTTALVGASGAGKTTLADLIPRFFDPTEGKILVDDINLRDLEINTLRRRMAIVSQDTFIFNTSVRRNIAYGLADVNEDDILAVAKQANALDFILDLPERFETQLGDRGVRLSGGQRQRIAIARALLRNPEILILDEATSALDSVTERLIQDALEKLSTGRTVIAIAHRLSTIVGADKVVVLDQGRVLEQGKYQELLEQRGKLWQYHQMQYEFNQSA